MGRGVVDTLHVPPLHGSVEGGGGGTRGDGEFRRGKATCSMVLIYKNSTLNMIIIINKLTFEKPQRLALVTLKI